MFIFAIQAFLSYIQARINESLQYCSYHHKLIKLFFSFRYIRAVCLKLGLILVVIYGTGMSQEVTSVSSDKIKSTDFSEDWRWVHFTFESGLPKLPSYKPYETEEGTIWVSLYWYDSYQWRAVRDTIVTDQTIYGGYGENVFVSSNDGKQLYLANKEGISLFYSSKNSLITNLATVYSKDTLMFANNEGSLFLFTQNTLHPFPFTQGQFNNKVIGLSSTKSGAVFINALDGLYRLKESKRRIILPSKQRSLFLPSGSLWCAENTHGFGCTYVSLPYNLQGLWTWNKNSQAKRVEGSYPLAQVIALDISPSNEIITIHDNGEVRLWQDSSSIRLIEIESRFKNISFAQFRDNGDLWIGTDDGLHLYRRSIKRWNVIAEQGDVPENNIHEILRTRDSSLWLGTREGITIIKSDGTRERITTIGKTTLHAITGLGEDSDGNIWISSGATFDGAYRWDRKEWKYFPIFNNPYGNLIHKIRKDREGRLWFLGIGNSINLAGNLQPGAFLYDQGTFERWDVQKGLLDGRVFDFAEGPDGSYWFAVRSGISRWKDGKWNHWTSENGLMNPIYSVNCLTIDIDGTVWFGHGYKGGLGQIDTKGIVHYYTINDGLASNAVRDVHFDNEHNLWISTSNGISCFSDGKFITYNQRTGLSTPQTWPLLIEDDNILVGTMGGGLAILDRKQQKSPPPRIHIEPPKTVGSQTILEWKTLSYWNEIPPSEILTRYRLDTSGWSSWTINHNAQFLEMNHGEHTLHVQAKGLFGEYIEPGETLSFTIPPPLMLRPLVLYPMLTLILSVIGLGVTLFIRRRNHVKELIASESKFRGVTERTASAILVFDDDRLITFVNVGARKLFRYDEQELLSMKFDDLIHPTHRLSFTNEELQRKGNTSASHRKELQIVCKNGEERWIDLTYGWVKFQNEYRTMATAFDITERKKAEEALKRSEQNFRVITEMIADYAYLDRIDEEGRRTPLWITDSFYRLTGYTVEEVQSPDFTTWFTHPDDLEDSIQSTEKLMGGQSIKDERRIVRKDGKILWLAHEARPTWDNTLNRVTHIYGAAHDITDDKIKQLELHKLSHELTQTEQRERRRIAQFLHDVIGQSLAMVKLKLQEHEVVDTASQQKSEMTELFKLVDQTIDNTRTATFELYPPVLYEFGIITAIEWLVQKMREQHRLIIEIDNIVGECKLKEETAIITFNTIRELLMNVIKHAEATTIRITFRMQGLSLDIRITDNGKGFDMNDVDRKISSSKSFGIFNAKQQISATGGNIEFFSRPGEGAQFKIRIPVE